MTGGILGYLVPTRTMQWRSYNAITSDTARRRDPTTAALPD